MKSRSGGLAMKVGNGTARRRATSRKEIEEICLYTAKIASLCVNAAGRVFDANHVIIQPLSASTVVSSLDVTCHHGEVRAGVSVDKH
jgi:hypothetical protein